MTTNQLTYWANKEQARTNAAREAETRRANEEKERQGVIDLMRKQAELDEKIRSNKANEELKDSQLFIEGFKAPFQAAGSAVRVLGSVL